MPFAGSRCFYPWSAAAKDAGNYLAAAGFRQVISDWYLSNALVGDIAVLPDIAFIDIVTGNVITYPTGHIMMKYRDDPTGAGQEWVSDFFSTHNVYSGVLDATTVLPTVYLYRLREDTDVSPAPGEVLVPFVGSSNAVSNPTAWAAMWSSYDAYVTPLNDIVASVAHSYNCPASNGGAFPQQLWSVPLHPEQAKTASICYRLLAGGNRHYGVRCCYDAHGAYILQWPSQVEYAVPSPRTIEDAIDPELVSCLRPGQDSDACKIYRTRRPSPPSTNNVYGGTQLWAPSVRWGMGLGDPHCGTYDGIYFECNFRGEALWTACGSWAVHAVADSIGTGVGTVITRVAVRGASDTFFGLIDNTTSAGFALYLNGVAVPQNGATGNDMSVLVDNTTVTIIDGGGNIVRAVFGSQLVVLATVPTASLCANKTSGLCGNNNGDPSDDLWPQGASVPMALNSTNASIYDNLVISWLITDVQHSLFPQPLFFAGNISYLPAFVNESTVLSGCPSTCNNDTSCCFDVSIGGASFAQSYVSAKAVFNMATALAVKAASIFAKISPSSPKFTQAPAFIQLPADFTSVDVLTVTYVIQYDGLNDYLTAFSCNVCPDYAAAVAATISANITTEDSLPSVAQVRGYLGCFPLQPLSSNRTQLVIKVTDIAQSFAISCFAALNTSDVVLRATTTIATYTSLIVSTPVPLSQQITIGNDTSTVVIPRWTPAPLAGARHAASHSWLTMILLAALTAAALIV